MSETVLCINYAVLYRRNFCQGKNCTVQREFLPQNSYTAGREFCQGKIIPYGRNFAREEFNFFQGKNIVWREFLLRKIVS